MNSSPNLGEHSHQQAYKIKGPFSIVSPQETTPKEYYIVKYHYHPTPNSPPQKTQIIVPKVHLGSIVSYLTGRL